MSFKVKVKVSPHSSLGYCKDCRSVHLNPGCGLTYRERLSSQRLDQSWMLAKSKRNYFDSEALGATFGEDAEERLKEETVGVGAVSQDEWNRYQDLQGDIVDFYTDGPEDEDR